MNLLHVYNLLNTGEISHAQAAEAFGFTEQSLTFRMTRHGDRLPLILAVLDQIKADKISRIEAAERLGVSDRQINKLMESWSAQREIDLTKSYLVGRAASKVKWEVRKNAAIDFIEGKLNFEMAAETANCSTRQIRRWVDDLLKKHYEMPYKDLLTLSMTKRARLAQEIRTAEGLEKAKQEMAIAIADGRTTVKDEAIKRVLAKRSIGRKENA